MNAENEKNFDELMSRAIGQDNQQFDFNKWKDSHQKEIAAYKSQTADGRYPQPVQPFNLWRIIMKNPITKFSAAAVLIVVTLVLNQFGTSIDPASTAFAKVLRNTDNMPWVHIISKAKIIKEDSPLSSGGSDSEQWFNISSKIAINIYGKVIHYSDFTNKINYSYRPNENKLLISAISTTWEETIKYKSNSDFLSVLLQLPEQFTGNITRRTSEYQNKKVDIYQINARIDPHADNSHPEYDVEFDAAFEAVVDKTTNLIIVVFEKIEDLSGQHIGDLEISFSYPKTGPKDIYELGVPDIVEVVNYLNQSEE